MWLGRKLVRTVGWALVVLSVPALGRAQQWQTLDVSRQIRDSGDHRVRVQYGAGRLEVRPTTEPVQYTMHLRYDEDHARPVHRYSAEGRSLTVGLTDQSVRVGRHMGKNSLGEMQLGLNASVPVGLEVNLGAGTSDIDLGGLAVRDLRLHTGASASRLTFSSPNTARLSSIDLDAGAATVEASGLGNANTGDVRVRGGVGSVTLDFGGLWSRDMAVDADMALGKITMRIPPDVGVRVETKRVLASFTHDGLYRRGGAYYSDNWDTAKYRLRIHVQTVFGAIEVDRRERRVGAR